MASELATAYISLVPTTKGIQGAIASELGVAQTAASKAGKDAGGKFSSGFKKALKVGSVGLAGVGLVVGSIVKDSIELEASFSKTMRQVAVASRAPQAELKSLNQLALKLGAQTSFSANEAAGAMLSLAKGGLSAAQIKAGALADTLTLAAAGSLDLDTAANAVVGAMGAFQLGAKDTGAAVSALAGAANASQAEVSDITQALAQVGTSAHASGLTIQETTGILAAFSRAGIQGSDAGTSLKTMLQRLVPQTEKARGAMADLGLKFTDANGNFVSATQIAGRLQEAFKGLSDAERSKALSTIFGSDAQRAANVLITEGAGGLAKYIKATSDQTQAQKLAKASMSGTAGALDQMSGAIETAELKIGKALAPTVIDVSHKLTNFLATAPIQQWTTQFVGGVTSAGQQLAPLATDLFDIGRDAMPLVIDSARTATNVLDGLLQIAKPLLSAFSSLPQPVRDFTLAMGAARLAGFSGGLSRVRSVLSDLVLDFRTAPSKVGTFTSRLRGLGGAMRGLAGPAGLGALVASTQTSNDALSILGSTAGGALLGFEVGGPIGAAIGAGVGGLAGLAGAFTDAADSAQESKVDFQSMASSLDQITGAATRATRALVAQDLQQQGVLSAATSVGIKPGDLTSAILGDPAAIKRVNAVLAEYQRHIDAIPPTTTRMINTGSGWQQQTTSNAATIDRMQGNLDLLQGALTSGTKKWEDDARAQRQTAAETRGVTVDTQEYNRVLKSLPNAVATQIKQLGIDVAKSDIFNLAKQYKLAPKQVITTIKALGWDLTFGNIVKLNKQYDLTPRELATALRQSGFDPTHRQAVELFSAYDKLPKDVVTYLREQGGQQLVRDVQRAASGVKGALHGVADEDIGVNLTTQAAQALQAVLSSRGQSFQLHPHLASGGRVFGGGTSTSDSITARLSRGEFVIREAIARRLYPFLEALNAGQGEALQVAGLARGGVVGVQPAISKNTLVSDARAYALRVQQIAEQIADSYGSGISKIANALFAFGGTGQPLGPGGTLSFGQLLAGQRFAQSQAGKPYGWGKVGPYAYDCSGAQSAVLNAALGRYPYSRLGSTGTMPWSGSSPGVGRYTIGWFTGDPGHTSGNIAGLNVESSGDVGFHVGSSARSPLDPMFNGLMHYDSGGLLRPGYTLAYNGTGRNELVAAYAEGGKVGGKGLSDKFIAGVLSDVRGDFGAPVVKAIRDWLRGLKRDEFSRSALRSEIAEAREDVKKALTGNVLGRLADRFGRRSPIVDAISRWLDGIKKGEFSQRELHKRIRDVIRRNVDPALRQFRVGPRQSRSETRSEVRELLSSLRQLLGKDAPLLKRVDRLGERLVKVQDRQDKAVAKYQRANDKLDSITQRQNQLVSAVRQAFTHDAFGTDINTVRQSRIQIRADRNDAQRTLRQFRRLSARGLDAGIIKQLAKSGNTALIRDLTRMTPKQLKAFERDIKARNKATSALGEFVGNKAFGPQIREQRRVVRQLNRSVNHWDRVIERMEKRVERATARGARIGVQAGMRDREGHNRRRRRAKAVR